MNTGATAGAPPDIPSKEADVRGLELAKEQGSAFMAAVEHMVGKIAQTGDKMEAGEFIVGFAVEKAEGMYQLRGSELVWEEPTDDNIHVEIIVCDRSDNRFVPNLNVDVTLFDDQGAEIGTNRHPLLWHPYLYHYGKNWSIPGDGKYDIHVRIEPPEFPRHDRINGRRFNQLTEAKFKNVTLKTGKA